VLFTSYYLRIDDLPTALKSMTPYLARRPILGGTFSHWSPVARALWVGRSDARLLPGQVELTDDVSLAGRSWADWTDADFFDLCHQLNVTTVVATWEDFHARTFLDAAPHFEPFYADTVFVLYRVLGLTSNLIEARGAKATLLRATPHAIDVQVADAMEGAILRIKMTDYPLWRAEANGEELSHHAGSLGLMNIILPAGTYDLSLRYRTDLVGRLGTWITLSAAVAGIVALALSCLRKSRASS
jgi:hypothetical protein